MSLSSSGISRKQTPDTVPVRENRVWEQSLLDNASVQIIGGLSHEYELAMLTQLQRRFRNAAAAEKLRAMKTQHFTLEHRAERIEKSLRALHSQQLFATPVAEWRWAVDDIESEEQE